MRYRVLASWPMPRAPAQTCISCAFAKYVLSIGEKLRACCAVWCCVDGGVSCVVSLAPSLYLHVHEADEALNCYSRNSTHQWHAATMIARRLVTLDSPSAAIDELYHLSPLPPANAS